MNRKKEEINHIPLTEFKIHKNSNHKVYNKSHHLSYSLSLLNFSSFADTKSFKLNRKV